MGAWSSVFAALGMALAAQTQHQQKTEATAPDLREWIPARVRLADYPQLKALAWQIHGADSLTPAQAHSIYERNARHLDQKALFPSEQALMQALQVAFGAMDV
jgi:hypothetical protein